MIKEMTTLEWNDKNELETAGKGKELNLI